MTQVASKLCPGLVGALQVIGRTYAGRWLVVIWIDDPAGRYPIHAREASRRTFGGSADEGEANTQAVP